MTRAEAGDLRRRWVVEVCEMGAGLQEPWAASSAPANLPPMVQALQDLQLVLSHSWTVRLVLSTR